MSKAAFESIYNQAIDIELGLIAIREIARHASSASTSVEADRLHNAIEWIADRATEKLAELSEYAEEQTRPEKPA